jgi:GNAT superfamily N-acetyltransferase
LLFRPFRTATDYVALADIRERAGRADLVDRRSAREALPSADDIAQTFPLPAAINSPDLLLVEHHAQVIGYAHVWWRWTEVSGTRIFLHLGYLVPEWRGRGIGRTLVQWAQQRIRTLVALEPVGTAAMFATNVSTTEPAANTLFQQLGYTVVRRMSDMVLDPLPLIVPSDLPADVILHAVTPAHYRAIYDAWKDGLSDFWTSTPASESDYQEFLADYTASSTIDVRLWQVAWADDQVIGLVIASRNPSSGIIDQVVVRRAWHRRGIGRALMGRALAALHAHAIDHVRLFTDAANEHGARQLYEHFGFRELKQHLFYRKPIEPS